MDIIFHYPADLMRLLIDTIPLLNTSKPKTLLFFKESGVSEDYYRDLDERVKYDKNNISKYEIVQTILTRLNEKGEATLRERREILKRVEEFEEFSSCWPDDRLKAVGLVSEVKKLRNVKDSFTRMNIERRKERELRLKQQEKKALEIKKKREKREEIKKDLYKLFSKKDPHKRGIELEGVLNRLFESYGILLRESFTLKDPESKKTVCQIDGVIELKGQLYLVEMKWLNEPVGKEKISNHLVDVFNRGQSRSIFISASGYTEGAINVCKESLHRTVIILCGLEEIVFLLEKELDLKTMLNEKVNESMINKNPYYHNVK